MEMEEVVENGRNVSIARNATQYKKFQKMLKSRNDKRKCQKIFENLC